MSNQKSRSVAKKNKAGQKGVALYLTLVLLSVTMAALLVLLSIVLSQTKIIRTINDSVFAFYAADTGIERVLYKVFQELWDPATGNAGDIIYPEVTPPEWVPFSVGAKYQVIIQSPAPALIWSIGEYNGTIRKIEINLD